MKLSLSLRRSSDGCSSSQQTRPDSHKLQANVDGKKHRPVNGDSSAGLGPPPNLSAPPPYTPRLATPEIHMNRHGVAGFHDAGPSFPAAGAVGSSRTLHTFATADRVQDIAYFQAPMRRESKENALDMLRGYDTVIIMDDSASMLKDRRWEQACEALSELARTAASYDTDGIDIHFLNHAKHGTGVKDPLRVRHLFRHVKPQGLTPIANKLDVLVGDYIEKLERATRKKKKGDASAFNQIKPVNFIVITDGAPTDEPVDSIVALARRLDRGNYPLAQVGIQFVQIGDDKSATEFLKQLDDDLSGTYGVRDIVDTTPFLGIKLTAEMLIKILLGGINRRVDRRGGGAVMGV